MASAKQRKIFRRLAQHTDFALDVNDSPKRQFSILAKLRGWEGGEATWNANWKLCFGEDYRWGSGKTPPNNVASNNAVNYDVSNKSIWSQFEGFIPNPRASFNTEFRRLWIHQGWNKDERRIHRVEIFDADFDALIGSDVCNLEQWQLLCRLCSIDPVPDKITGCMEELDNVLVNIYDILDSQRTGEPVVPFDSFDDFQEYTLDDHVYPLELAKADSFLPVFLKEISSRRRMK